MALGERRRRWQEPSVLIGLGGLVATVVVGVITFWLSSGQVSREYLQRVRTARGEVLVAVSKSIGEGVVPDREKIQAVIDSIRRRYEISEKDYMTVDAVVEDLLTRVLANEFLDARKREELSARLLALRGCQDCGGPILPEPPAAETRFALFSAISAAVIAAMTVMLMTDRLRRAIREMSQANSGEQSERLLPLLRQLVLTAVLLVGVVAIMAAVFALTLRSRY